MIEQSHFWVYSQRNGKQVSDLHTNVHRSFIHNSQEVKITHMSDRWTDKMLSIHTVEYYLALKKKEPPSHAATWINSEEIRQSQKRQILVWFHLFEVSNVVKLIETGSRMVFPGTGEREKSGAGIKWAKSFSFTEWKSSRDVLHKNDQDVKFHGLCVLPQSEF